MKFFWPFYIHLYQVSEILSTWSTEVLAGFIFVFVLSMIISIAIACWDARSSKSSAHAWGYIKPGELSLGSYHESCIWSSLTVIAIDLQLEWTCLWVFRCQSAKHHLGWSYLRGVKHWLHLAPYRGKGEKIQSIHLLNLNDEQ